MANNLIEDKKRLSIGWLALLTFFIVFSGIFLTGSIYVLNKAKDKSVSVVTYTTSDLNLGNVTISLQHPRYYIIEQPFTFSGSRASYFYIEYKYRDIYDQTTHMSDSTYGTIKCEVNNYSDDTIQYQTDNYLELSKKYTDYNFTSENGDLGYQLAETSRFSRYEYTELTIDGKPAVRTNIFNNDTNPSIMFMILHIYNQDSFQHCYMDFNYSLSTSLDVTTFDKISNSVRFW